MFIQTQAWDSKTVISQHYVFFFLCEERGARFILRIANHLSLLKGECLSLPFETSLIIFAWTKWGYQRVSRGNIAYLMKLFSQFTRVFYGVSIGTCSNLKFKFALVKLPYTDSLIYSTLVQKHCNSSDVPRLQKSFRLND